MRHILRFAPAITLLFSSFATTAAPLSIRPFPQDLATALPQYPDSPEGLKQLLEDVLAAVKSKDSAKSYQYFGSLALPSDGLWLQKTFGNTDGARLTAKYVQLQPQASADLQKMFEYALKDNRTTVSVKAYTREAEPKIGAIRAVLEAMSVPAAIYTADGSNSNSQYSAVLGDYVFVDGGFRFLNSHVLQALSTAPAMRIRVGGNVAAAKLVHRVSPIYPPITQTAHIKGTVRLHVIVGVDGAPKEITVVSGDQALAQSSLDAVRQWRYAVTTLNGAPVEVDTTVDVVFQ